MASKPGWKTTEFWATVAVVVPSITTALSATGNPALLTVAAAVSGIYTISRTIAKAVQDTQAAAAVAALPPGAIMTAAGPVMLPVPGKPIEMTVTHVTAAEMAAGTPASPNVPNPTGPVTAVPPTTA